MSDIIPFGAYDTTWTKVLSKIGRNLDKSNYKTSDVARFTVDATDNTIELVSILEMKVLEAL